jgi:hypothetical protein
VVIAVLTTTGHDGPAQQFERSAKTFHDRYRGLSDQLGRDLPRAGEGFGDHGFVTASLDVRKLGEAFDAYGKAVAAIRFPDRDKAPAADLVDAIRLGSTTMYNAADSFGRDAMKAILDQYRPQIDSAVDNAEKALRKALGVT